MAILGILARPITEVGKCLFLPLKNEIGYLFHYKRNIKNLIRHADYLQSRRNDIQVMIEAAHWRLEEPTELVLNWLKRTDDIQTDVRIIEEAVKESRGWCLNLVARYRLSRKAEWKLVIVMELHENGNFNRVSHDLAPPSIESLPVGDFEVFGSTESAMKQVMDALIDESINVIGVYGMGGVGKTMLMKEVGKKVKRENICDVVMMITVSQFPDMIKIQSEIAAKLGMRLQEESESARAGRILKRMKLEKTILVILDDLWERLELSRVGIPYRADHNGCKIMLTTRSLDVCNVMETDANIAVDVLAERDSWKLFRRKAGDGVNSAPLFPVARDVANECGGLPLALVTIGRALKDKKQSMWANALIQLRRSIPTNIEGMHSKVFSSLMLSYNSLESNEIKLCFLFCCLFPDDYNINMDKLMRYVMGEGFLSDVYTLEEASRKVHDLVDKLKASCLLLDGDEEGYVKMHDVVRDAAISISSKDGHGFLVKVGQSLREWPEWETLENCKRISLMNNRISTLPNRAECPELITLLMQNNWSLTNIPNSFFEGMKSLQVLDLNNTHITSLPPSLASLTNLRTLCIHKCRSLRDFSLVGSLKRLEILRISGTKIIELPKEIGELANLKLLDLSNTENLQRVPPNVIAKLTRLEELYMGKSFNGWEVDGNQASFAEVGSLPDLTVLYCHIRSTECLTQDIFPPWRSLTKYCICVNGYYRDGTSPRSMLLDISYPISNWVKALLERASDLDLVNCKGLENLAQLHERGFHNLERLQIKDCTQMDYLITVVGDIARNEFVSLNELNLNHMENLKKICDGPPSSGFFKNLRILTIQSCPKLVSVFPYDLQKRTQNLERLEVCECDELQEVFYYEELVEGNAILSMLQEIKLKNLHKLTQIWKGKLPLGSFQNLQELCVGGCTMMKNLFSFSQAQTLQQLKRLEIKYCKKIERIVAANEEAGLSRSSGNLVGTPNSLPVLRNLQKLSVSKCTSFKSLFSMRLARSLQQLEELRIRKCPGMEEVVAKEEEEEEDDDVDKGMLPRLKILTMYRLPNLRKFYQGPFHLDFPSLECLKMWRCPNLRRLPLGQQSAPKLQKIEGESMSWFQALEWEDEVIKARFEVFFQA